MQKAKIVVQGAFNYEAKTSFAKYISRGREELPLYREVALAPEIKEEENIYRLLVRVHRRMRFLVYDLRR